MTTGLGLRQGPGWGAAGPRACARPEPLRVPPRPATDVGPRSQENDRVPPDALGGGRPTFVAATRHGGLTTVVSGRRTVATVPAPGALSMVSSPPAPSIRAR